MSQDIDVCAWAPSREIARSFMVAVGIAEERDGQIVPIVDCRIDEIGPIAKADGTVIDGWHVNVRYYGAAADMLTNGLPQTDQDGNLLDIFTRTRILQLVDARTGDGLAWNANAPPLPPGYVNADGVRLFDCAVRKTPSRVWA